MILNQILKYKKYFIKYINTIQRCVLALIFASLFFVKPYINKIYTDQSLHEHIFPEYLNQPKYDIITNKISFQEYDRIKNSFIIGQEPPFNTIYMKARVIDLKYLITLYSSIKKKKNIHKGIIIHIHDTVEFYEAHKKKIKKIIGMEKLYKNVFLRLKCGLKGRFSDYSICDSVKYFATFNIEFGNTSFVMSDFLKNYQPNSDLLFLANKAFPIRKTFSIKNLLYPCFSLNVINLTIRKEIREINKMVNLCLCISNLHSHANGIYYYLPLNKIHFRYANFIPLLLLIITSNILVDFKQGKDVFKKALNFNYSALLCVLYIFIPAMCIPIIIISKIDKNLLIIFFSAVNPLIGVIYAICNFIICL